jgi:hypothetical protein
MVKNKSIVEIEDRVKPNTFVTLTLCQGITNMSGTFITGSPEAYERAVQGLYKAVARRLYSKRRWRRTRPRLANLTSLEKGRDGRWHIHACIRRPSHVTIEQFQLIVEECWKDSRWALDRTQIEEYRGGGLSYILKEGQDSILVNASNF